MFYPTNKAYISALQYMSPGLKELKPVDKNCYQLVMFLGASLQAGSVLEGHDYIE